jgi:hypothetical protein
LDLAKKGIEQWGGWGRGRSIDLAWLWLPPDDPERQEWVDELVPILSRILGPTGRGSQPFEPTTTNEWLLKRVVTVLGRIGPISLERVFEDLLIDLENADHWPSPASEAKQRQRVGLRRATERALDDLAQQFGI